MGASSANYTIDTTQPVISSVVMSDSALKVGETSTLTITFSEAVTNFDNTDITLANGTLTAVSSADGGVTWTGTFTPTDDIEDTSNVISVGTTLTDLAGNAPLAGASTANYTIDTKEPVVSSVVMSDSALKVGETSTLTITFSEAVTGFDNTDITLANGTLTAVSSADGGVTWTGTFTPTDDIEDTSNVISVGTTLDRPGRQRTFSWSQFGQLHDRHQGTGCVECRHVRQCPEGGRDLHADDHLLGGGDRFR